MKPEQKSVRLMKLSEIARAEDITQRALQYQKHKIVRVEIPIGKKRTIVRYLPRSVNDKLYSIL